MVMNENSPILTVIGPTGIGKTDLALQLAKGRCIEIISLDAMLVYRGMDIGTAKPAQAAMLQVPHHLINTIDPDQAYSVAAYVAGVRACIVEIQARQSVPVLVGGSMMYVWTLLHGLSKLPQRDENCRQLIAEQAQAQGWPAMWLRLAALDPITAAKLAPHDQQRIGRALEVIAISKKPYSTLIAEGRHGQIALDIIKLWPNDRAVLYEKIAVRFQQMLAQGFMDEVQQLYDNFPRLTENSSVMRAVGYRQVSAHLLGQVDYDVMCDKAKQATRQLAKRQITWMKKMPGMVCQVDHLRDDPYRQAKGICSAIIDLKEK